jgi:protein phosphatase
LASVVLHYNAAAATDRGCKRPTNEDAFGFTIEHGIYLVCDGMGGAAAGEVASSLAVDEMLRLLGSASVASQQGEEETLLQRAEKAVQTANEAIYTRSKRNPRLSGMGTTMVALLTEGDRAWMLNIGDSRGYRLRKQKLEQLTQDHSLVDEQVREGRMTPAEALRSPLRNVITRAVGTQSGVTPDILSLEVEAGDQFLLCSDGLTRELSDAEIETILNVELPIERQCNRLVEAAKKSGGSDNVTCLLVQVTA